MTAAFARPTTPTFRRRDRRTRPYWAGPAAEAARPVFLLPLRSAAGSATSSAAAAAWTRSSLAPPDPPAPPPVRALPPPDPLPLRAQTRRRQRRRRGSSCWTCRSTGAPAAGSAAPSPRPPSRSPDAGGPLLPLDAVGRGGAPGLVLSLAHGGSFELEQEGSARTGEERRDCSVGADGRRRRSRGTGERVFWSFCCSQEVEQTIF
ncbi:hypothetical protein SEVIR_7G262150v4 [Setaria viridis]